MDEMSIVEPDNNGKHSKYSLTNETSTAVIGIDFGTSGVRCLTINDQGLVIYKTYVHYPSSPKKTESPDHIEQQPEDWVVALLDCLKNTIQALSSKIRIKAIALDGTSGTFVPVDMNGNPLGPALMYSDRRSKQQARVIDTCAPTDSPAKGSSSALAKLLWWIQKNPDQKIIALHQSDWLSGLLVGNYDCTDENNALKMGYNPITRQWPTWVKKILPRQAHLPKVVPVGTPLGFLSNQFCQELNIQPGVTQIIAGTTDSVAGFFASGASKFGEASTSLGSTLALKILSKHPVFSSKYGVYSHRVGQSWLIGGASNAGGQVIEHYFTSQQIEDLTRQLNPTQPTGVQLYPLLTPGERFPISDPYLKPVMPTQPIDTPIFFQALLEGIANIEKMGYQCIANLGGPVVQNIRTTGGGAKSRPWQKIRERIIQIPILPAVSQQAAYGAALIAASTLKLSFKLAQSTNQILHGNSE